MTNSIQRIINNTILLFLFIIFLVTTFLIWNGIKNYYDFLGYQKAISFNTVRNAAGEINQYLSDKNRLVKLFVEDNLTLIKQISLHPEIDSDAYKALDNNVKRYFPGNFTFTITDSEGDSYITDFEGRIGDVCVSDLKVYLKDDVLLTRVHPNNVAYHFDIISRWSSGGKTGLFFVSFLTENLGRLINLAQIPKHNILAVNQKQENLIELTKDGARINWVRDDYRLSKVELSNKLTQIEIPNTYWHMIDLVDDDLFSDFINELILQSSLMFIFVIIIASFIIYILKNGQKVLLNEEKYKNDFISIVSNELRSPITAIIGSVDLILNGLTGTTNNKTLGLVKVVKQNGVQLKLLVDDLLDIQAIIYGTMKYRKEPCNVVSFVNDTIKDHQSHETVTINCLFNTADKLNEASICIDVHRVSHVLRNLLKNAIRQGKSDNIEVTVERCLDNIRISVTDHGEGIPERYKNVVFDRFVTVHDDTILSNLDVGLGLNLVKKIIEAHDGKVDFKTEKGKGTTFYIDIPEYHTN